MNVKCFPFNPIGENTYIAYDETKECVIIDAGCFYQDERETLLDFIVDNDLVVKHLLNTHMHFDHVFGNTFIKDQFGLKTKAHEGDQFLLDGLEAQMRMFGFKNEIEKPEVGQYLTEEDTIEFGNQKFLIFHIPGHSPGSIVFYNEDAGCAFVGDVLFRGSVGRTDLAGGSHELLINGIREKLLRLPLDTIIYSGHGPTTTIRHEIQNNPFL